MKMMSSNCFNALVEQAVILHTQGQVSIDEFTPSLIYQMIENEEVQNEWDSLSAKDQELTAYDVRDQLQEGLIYDYEYSQDIL